MPTHGLRAAVAAAAAATAVLALAGPAQATDEPTSASFLAAAELPPHPTSPWYAGEVTEGLPEHQVFCVQEVLAEASVAHREYWTEYDTGALQLVAEAGDEAAAELLAEDAEEAVRTCATRYEQDYPTSSAHWRDYGPVDVEDGAHLYGLATRTDYGANDINLFGVGRDGTTVTVVRWGQMGTFEHAEVDAFTHTVHTAVAGLHS